MERGQQHDTQQAPAALSKSRDRREQRLYPKAKLKPAWQDSFVQCLPLFPVTAGIPGKHRSHYVVFAGVYYIGTCCLRELQISSFFPRGTPDISTSMLPKQRRWWQRPGFTPRTYHPLLPPPLPLLRRLLATRRIEYTLCLSLSLSLSHTHTHTFLPVDVFYRLCRTSHAPRHEGRQRCRHINIHTAHTCDGHMHTRKQNKGTQLCVSDVLKFHFQYSLWAGFVIVGGFLDTVASSLLRLASICFFFFIFSSFMKCASYKCRMLHNPHGCCEGKHEFCTLNNNICTHSRTTHAW